MIIEFLILMMCSIVASLTTYELNIRFRQGPVRASALIALFVGGFFHFFPTILPEFYTKNIPLYVIGGTFIGMVSSTINISYFSLVFSPILFAVLLHYTSKIFNGYGGALGTTACIALMCTMAFPIITKNKKITYGYRLIRIIFKKRKRKKIIKQKV
ncbi:hypothetical protein EB1_02240 [Empedobacter brevis NBRC 14943 = ATCC 43319]|uniref:Uncharacterized protein n=2 Tax=Empedobacter brevis TaxID=247 RepID=A0A511NC80_9FLAO|nr:hypothetical protein [Empedobacter brevis]GEM50434.1 hypothetical protein EB1_02240 [Empedobacter brevis NBRC 14943 = ATCC 43319]